MTDTAAVIGLAKWAHRLAAEAADHNIPSWDTLSDRSQAMWIKRARESGYVEDAPTAACASCGNSCLSWWTYCPGCGAQSRKPFLQPPTHSERKCQQNF